MTASADPLVTGIKWGGSGGTPLTRIVSLVNTGDEKESGLWYLVAPTVQTSTLYFTFASSSIRDLAFSATVWDNVTQTTPFSGADHFWTSWSTTHSITISSATNSIVIDSITCPQAVTCSQTEDGNTTIGNISAGQSHKAGAASVLMSWTTATNNNSSMVAASLAPYADASHINIALAVGGS
jgi:hypothetical protein